MTTGTLTYDPLIARCHGADCPRPQEVTDRIFADHDRPMFPGSGQAISALARHHSVAAGRRLVYFAPPRARVRFFCADVRWAQPDVLYRAV